MREQLSEATGGPGSFDFGDPCLRSVPAAAFGAVLQEAPPRRVSQDGYGVEVYLMGGVLAAAKSS